MQPLQFNWILEKGGFLSHGNGSFSVDHSPKNLPTISYDMCATSEFFLLAVDSLQESVQYGEEVTEICLDDNKLGNTWGAVVVDASEGMCRRFEPTKLEN